MPYSFNIYFSDDKVPKIIDKFGDFEKFQEEAKKKVMEMLEDVD